jgi:sec-independent protein translocase protein TatB
MGMWELVVVLIVGLVVLGPERLPVAIRTVSRWIKTIKSVANSVKAEVNEELRIHELHSNLKKAEQQNMEDLAPALKESVEELKKAAESVQHSYKQPAQHTPVEQKNDNQK